jgi:methionyl aminopeptidase
MIVIKGPAELERMRASGRVAAKVRDAVARSVAPGVTTQELSDFAAELMRQEGAKSAFLGYRGYPGVICVSVNEVVVHGIPGPRRIQMGDIVSIDVGVVLDGFIGDTATTVMVGTVDARWVQLVRTAERALGKAIEVAVAGRRLSDVSHAVESEARANGMTVVRDFVGHGIGRKMHEDPQVPNFGKPGKGPILKEGMTLAIEPMVNLGGYEVEVLEDRWTAVTRDRMPSAHFEHTVAVRNGSAEILTLSRV